MKELFLGLFFAFEKLDIVDQQHVDVPVTVAKLDGLVVLDRDMNSLGTARDARCSR